MADPGNSYGPSHSKSDSLQSQGNSAGTKAPVASRTLPRFFFHDRSLDDFSTPCFEPPTPPVQSVLHGFVPDRKYGQEAHSATKSVADHAQDDLLIEPPTPLMQQDVDQFYPALKLERRRRSSSFTADLPSVIDENSVNKAEAGGLFGVNRKLSYLPANSQTVPDMLSAEQHAGPITKMFSFQALGDVFRRSHAPIGSNEQMKVSDLEVHMMSPGSL